MTAAYNYPPLYTQGFNGKGKTIAIIDSFGSPTIASDLHVFNTAFGLQSMCGEAGVTCTSDMPTFQVLEVQGSPPPLPQPPNNGTGQEDHFAWAVEVSLDVEWAHATAPGANIILVTTPTAETLGVQGFPAMMNAVQFVVDHHLHHQHEPRRGGGHVRERAGGPVAIAPGLCGRASQWHYRDRLLRGRGNN
jgi:subtilase family serine protease